MQFLKLTNLLQTVKCTKLKNIVTKNTGKCAGTHYSRAHHSRMHHSRMHHNTVQSNTPQSNTPQSNTPQSNTPQSNTPQSNTPQSNTPQSTPFHQNITSRVVIGPLGLVFHKSEYSDLSKSIMYNEYPVNNIATNTKKILGPFAVIASVLYYFNNYDG